MTRAEFFPPPRVLGSEMPNPPGSDPAGGVVTASAATLTMPQLGEAEKGQMGSGAVHGPVQDIKIQLSDHEERIREDKEWLESPAHPRNWPSRKKWSNMAIVSRSPPRPPPDPPQHLSSVILGFVLHVSPSAHKFDDGARPATDRRTFPRDESDDNRNVTQYSLARLDLFSPHHCPTE